MVTTSLPRPAAESARVARADGGSASVARRLAPLVAALFAIVATAAALPQLIRTGPGPQQHISVRGEEVITYGVGPYRHMPADVAVQGLAQDLVTLAVALPLLLLALRSAMKGSRRGYVVLCGVTGYLFVQYFMYLAMATFNELFLLWVAALGVSAQLLFRLLLRAPAQLAAAPRLTMRRRRGIATFLLVNGALISLLWLGMVVPPLLSGALYPKGLAHLTTLVVQGFDLALFLPASLVAGVAYARGSSHGALLAPVYCVFLALQMTALLAKIIWMTAVGAAAGPALVMIPLLLVGAIAAASVSVNALKPAVADR